MLADSGARAQSPFRRNEQPARIEGYNQQQHVLLIWTYAHCKAAMRCFARMHHACADGSIAICHPRLGKHMAMAEPQYSTGRHGVIYQYTLYQDEICEEISTFCEPSLAACGCAEHSRAAAAHHHALGVAEDCCSAGQHTWVQLGKTKPVICG